MNRSGGYISIREASCRFGRRSWAIPADAEKPSGPRIKNTKGGGIHDLR